MKYRCRACKREFDVLAWFDTTSNYYPSVSQPQITTTYSTSTSTKKPCCPFCTSLEIEETKKEES